MAAEGVGYPQDPESPSGAAGGGGSRFALTTDASPLGMGAIISAVDFQTEQLTPLAAII